jgi:exodeoxyribonuclease V gamma subunit
VHPIVDLARGELTATRDLQSLDVHVPLPDGRVVSGTVADLDADCLQTVQYSRVGPKHRLAAWVRLLALTASRPERGFRAVTIGRARVGSRHGSSVTIARLAPVADAAQQLASVIDLYDRGMREPAPLACETSAAYADAVRRNRDPEFAAQKAWTSAWRFDREDRDPEHRLLHGGEVPFGELLADPPRADETGPGWDATDQPSRFGRWAVRLWAPVLAREELEDS